MSVTVRDRIIVEPGKHSSRGASSAERWLNCSGSINLTEKLVKAGLVKLGAGRAAAEGTAAHLVLSTCLEDGSDAIEMKDITIEVDDWLFVVDNEMIQAVQETLDWVRDRISRAKKEGFEVHLYIEKSLTSIFDEDVYGTPDIIIHIVGDRLIVVDFKYGKGVPVEPTSEQNAYYGYLGLENYIADPTSIKVIESWIAQPRIPHPEGTIRRHITSAEELTDWWTNTVLPGIEDTRDPDANLMIGSHCRFCPNRGHCPALKSETFEFPLGIDANHLTDVQIGELLTKLDAIDAFKPVLESEALRRAREGSKIPGRKLVNKKANRKFKDTMALPDPEDADKMVETAFKDAVVQKFGLDAYTEAKVKSPAQIEKMDGGAVFVGQWAYTPNLGLTLAKEKDKRREVRPNIERVRGRVTRTV